MVGRPNKSGNVKKVPLKKYKVKNLETRGVTYKEPSMINSFWRNHTMDQIQSMTDEELMQKIDEFLDQLIARGIKSNKNWDFPITPNYLRIAPLPKK